MYGRNKPWITLGQITTWLYYIINTFFYMCCSIPLMIMNYHTKICLYSYIIISFFLICFEIIITMSNPKDNLLQNELRERGSILKQRQGKYTITIHRTQQYCERCCSSIHQKSRHCLHCDFCTEDYDHHCNWLNNCIGSCNYIYFMTLLVIVMIFEGSNTGVNIAVVCKQKLNDEVKVRIVFCYLMIIIDGFGLLYMIGLILFNIWLRNKGITMDEYARMRRNGKKKSKGEVKAKEKEKDMSESAMVFPMKNQGMSIVDRTGIALMKKIEKANERIKQQQQEQQNMKDNSVIILNMNIRSSKEVIGILQNGLYH